MNSKFEILLLQFDQPDELVWDEILSFAEQWNRTKENKFINDVPFELVIYFSAEDHKELKELEGILKQKQEEHEWAWIKTRTNNPTKEEIEAHDYIQIIGDGYSDEFLLNELDALPPPAPCQTCGTTHPHLRTQTKALKVNETFLGKKNIYPNYRYTPPGVDLVNMPHGALLVSDKVEQLLKGSGNPKGYALLDVVNQNGKVSDKLFQLVADKIILLPDNLTEEGAICPTCGTVLGALTGEFLIRKKRLGEASFFSRMPSGLSSIYVSNPLYHFLKSENVRGLTPVQGANLIDD